MTRPVLTASVIAVAVGLWASAPAFAADTDAPVITHVRITEAPEGQALPIRARIEDRSEIFAPSVYVRRKGADEFDNISMRKVLDAFEAIVPAEQVDADLEYFIEAFDEAGNGPAREGSPEDPIGVVVYDPAKGPPSGVVMVAPPPPPPPDVAPPPPEILPPDVSEDEQVSESVVKKWWFWTIIGVATAGVVGATAYGLTRSGAPLGPGPVDFVNIEVVGPDPTAGL